MKCTNCGLINPDTATKCDCGYNFTKGSTVKQETESYLWLVSTVVSLCIVLSVLIYTAFYFGTSDQLTWRILLLLVTGLPPCSVVVINWYMALKSKSWPMVTGEVIEADAKAKTSHAPPEGITEKLWFPRIRYRYSVFDRTYVSNRVAFNPLTF